MLRKRMVSYCVLLLLLLALMLTGCTDVEADSPPLPNPDDGTPAENVGPPDHAAQPEIIAPLAMAEVDISGMALLWEQKDLTLGPEKSARIALYVAAEIGEDGQPGFDDGQDWALLVETEDAVFPLFARQFLQLGAVEARVFYDMNSAEQPLHVLVSVGATASLELYDCVYDAKEQAFRRLPVAAYDNINYYGRSSY